MAFSEARRRGFSPDTLVSSPPSSVNGSANSWAVPSYQVAHDMLRVINARCVSRDLLTSAAGSVERTCWGQLATQ